MAQRKKGPRYYTTTKSAATSVAEIMALLMEFGADSFHVQQREKKPVGIAFVAAGIAFQLAPQVEGVRRRLASMSGTKVADAEAVAWAQLRNWTELQLELIENGVLSAAQAFGGYALTSDNRTVAEMIEERHGELMPGETRLLPPGRD